MNICLGCQQPIEFHPTNGYQYYKDFCRKCRKNVLIEAGICNNCQLQPAVAGNQRCEQCIAVKRNSDNKRYQVYKLAAFLAYSKTDPPTCVCCGHGRVLTIDHLGNNGAEHRLKIGNGANTLYSWLRKNNYPPGFRTLCFNCNSGRVLSACPHAPDYKPPILDTRYKRYGKRIKFEVFEHYSEGVPKCKQCEETMIGFLTIDHINGGGKQHYSSLTKSLYKWLRAENYPEGFQVLCFNCNHEKHVNNA